MSAEALLLPERVRPARPERGRILRPVGAPSPRRRPRLAYALLALGGAALIAVAQIGLTIATTQDSFVLAGLTSENRALTLEAQALQDELAGISSPQALATKASEMGMVVAGSASYLRLSDGTVAGAGSGAGWISSIDPKGSGAVANSLLADKTPVAAAEEQATEDAEAASDLPATLEQGLPTPSTH
ncbi:hypothetical protein [Microbacterium tumbae]